MKAEIMNQKESSYDRTGVVLEDADAEQESAAGPAIGVFEILMHLARRKKLIAQVTGAAMLLAIAYCLFQKPVYTSTTRFTTPQLTASTASILANPTSAASMLASSAGGLSLRNPNEIFLGMLNSRSVADALITEFDLQNAYKKKLMMDTRQTLAKRTKVESEKSGLIAVSVTDEDKTRAAAMANAYATQLRSLIGKMTSTEATERRAFYEDQVKQAKEHLVEAELNFQALQQKKGLVHLDAQAKSVIESLTALRARIDAKQVELQSLQSFSTQHNPEVQIAERQLETLRAEASQLERQGGSGDMGLQALAGAGVEYLSAEHELQYRQIMFDLLLKQFDAARLDEAKNATRFQIVEEAVPAERKSSPHRVLLVLTWAIYGFLGACAFILLNLYVKSNPELVGFLVEFRRALFSKQG
jgi:capsule polysaccharide export protein KpsE/RkpR